jgi:hypothetical protein
MVEPCAVCLRVPPAAAGLHRVGGANVCDPCYLGAAQARVRERGWSFELEQWEVVVNKNGDRLYYTRATVRLPLQLRVDMKCRRRVGLLGVLMGLLPRVKVGDELFDDHVYVRSSTMPAARALLSDEGVQSILLDMLGEGSWVAIWDASIRVFSRRAEYVPEARFSSELAVLAAHVVRLCGNP